MNRSTDDAGLRFTLSILSGPYQIQIVARLLGGPQTVPSLYRQLTVQSLGPFVSQLCSLWKHGLISVHVSWRQGLYCQLTDAGQSLQNLIVAMASWGERHRNFVQANSSKD
ncbi:MAG TPA: hypothetical protein DCW31_10215 [Lactobacillus sp.]|nr:hypothetical protein [Lactobacillus sp.]